MNDVSVLFRGSPVRFPHGTVVVQDTGRFNLSVNELRVKDLRLDVDLRNKMPPRMAQFAMKLDDNRTFTASGNLKIGWSGRPDETAWCQWEKIKVVFNDNKLGTGIPLEHIQGELDDVSGWSNGLVVKVAGFVKLESVIVLGQQVTRVESPFRIEDGKAELVNMRAKFLKGDLWGHGLVSLDATPSYTASITLHGAQLEDYARTLGGRRSYRGSIDARLECNGMGSDLRTLQGQGEAHIRQGDLGTLPIVLRIASLLNPTRTSSDAPRVRRQDGIRLGRHRVQDLARALDSGTDPVHRQCLQPPGPRHARSPVQPGPEAPTAPGPGPVPHPDPQRSHPRGGRAVPGRPRHGDPRQSRLQDRAAPVFQEGGHPCRSG